MKTPESVKTSGPNFIAHWYAYDFEVCRDEDELKRAMENINYHGFDLVCVTQAGSQYTVFFRRLAP